MRINFWVALVVFVASVVFFVWWQFRRPSETKPPKKPERRPRPLPPKGPKMAVPRGRVR